MKLTGNALMIANTLEFNDVGVITTSTGKFALLKSSSINSDGTISIVEPNSLDNDIFTIVSATIDGKSNYYITPKKQGQLKFKVSQAATDAYTSTTIEKTFIVVADTKELGTTGICADGEDNIASLTTQVEGQVSFNYTDESSILFNGQASWTIQFEGMPGILTFTPNGEGYWAIEESKGGGYDWSPTMIYWTQLPEVETSINLHPTARSVRISYSGNTEGSIKDLCIYPFSIYAEQSKIYVPIKNGSVQASVRFIHSESSLDVSVPGGWNTDNTKSYVSTSENQGGVFNTFYYTDVLLEASNVQEQNSDLTVTATQGSNSATVNIGAFDFPKPLPIESNNWVSDNSIDNNTNGYDESEHYYYYMVSSSYVKWDAQRKNLVFRNKGADGEASRQVVFGYYGLPNEVQFKSASKEWIIEEREDGKQWKNAINTSGERVIETDANTHIHTIKQPISPTSKYVRITFNDANVKDEVSLSELVIKGLPSAIPDLEEPYKVVVTDEEPATFDIHVMNLPRMKLALDKKDAFTLYHRPKSSEDDEDWTQITFNDEGGNLISYDNNKYPYLAVNEEGDITIKVVWNTQSVGNEGWLQILYPDNDEVLSEVHLVCQNNLITQHGTKTDIWTGYNPDIYVLEGSSSTPGSGFEPYEYHQVDVKNAFADGKTLFDYLIIYGETTTNDDTRTITTPGGENGSGSNARTPCYIYQKESEIAYKFLKRVDNANSSIKLHLDNDDDVIEVPADKRLSVYITGFCPYASTGYTYEDEGVWYFRGTTGSRLDLYLEECHIYSRNKTKNGAKYGKNHPESSETAFPGLGDGNNVVVHGSGAVLVFENKLNDVQNGEPEKPFNVAIHTIGHNILKSAYGSYNNILGIDKDDTQGDQGNQGVSGTVLVAQVSASVQVRLTDRAHHAVSKTVIDFDDKWPSAADKNEDGEFTSTTRTNGFLSLQKQANHAPSIDLGNPLTEINFRGGRVQLQNASILSPNYKTTFAISHRSGIMGNVPDVPFAYGLGSDDTGGTVNFYDGTTTVIPMTVEGPYRDFYLMDTEVVYENGKPVIAKDQNGNPILDDEGNLTYVTRELTTSCLRTPTNTFIYGGSHCMIRACNYVTSKGGAPTDGHEPLGRYEYTLQTGLVTNPDAIDQTNKLAIVKNFPKEGTNLANYYEEKEYDYGLESVYPANNKLYFWIPEVDPENYPVDAEVDKELIYWLIGMPEITGGDIGLKAYVGGNVRVDDDDEIKNILYCELDDYTYNVIRANKGVDGNGDTIYTYSAPAKDPTGQFSSDGYVSIPLVNVGPKNESSIIRASDYEVTNKLYYVTTAQADMWMNLTMPFDVAKVYIVETFSENAIASYFKKPTEQSDGETNMQATLRYQAGHNANFASFFAMSMAAIGAFGTTFEDIYNEYINWAKIQDDYVEGSSYNKRGMYELHHYDGSASSFFTANYYLYKNSGDWELDVYDNGIDDPYDYYVTKWQVAPSVENNGGILMNKDSTYSMLFPYCTGCELEFDEITNQPIYNEWNYWSGKLLIFESTDRTEEKNNPHIIHGSDYISVEPVEGSDHIFSDLDVESNKAVLTGNSTFSKMDLSKYPEAQDEKLFTYFNSRWEESYLPAYDIENEVRKYHTLMPTGTLLRVGDKTKKPIKYITRDGRVITDDSEDQGNGNQGTTTGGHMPTVGGGHDMFITGTDNGINVAVASPQMVYVVTPAGTIIYRGYVEGNINIPLPMSGIYIVKGENEVQKIFY